MHTCGSVQAKGLQYLDMALPLTRRQPVKITFAPPPHQLESGKRCHRPPPRATRFPVPRQCHGPSARPGSPCRGSATALTRDLSRGRLGMTSSEATCPVGGGSAAVKSPALPSRYHKQPACKKRSPALSMYCKPLACTPPQQRRSSRASCPVGGSATALSARPVPWAAAPPP